MHPSRQPSAAILRRLRQEVNFGCPVRFSDGTGCGCPVLTYHHFDPQWSGHYEHNEDGMIALCPEHHGLADGGHFSIQHLRFLKKNPYVDDRLKVRWPWTSETLLMKAGPHLIVGHGSPLTVDNDPVFHFQPVEIAALGLNTISFNSRIRDKLGSTWLSIDDNWFNLNLSGTTDATFSPQMRSFCAKHMDSTFLRLRFKCMPRVGPNGYTGWLHTVLRNDKAWSTFLKELDSRGVIDGDGRMPVVELEGSFVTPASAVKFQRNRMYFESFPPGKVEKFWLDRGFIMDSASRLEIRHGDRVLLLMG